MSNLLPGPCLQRSNDMIEPDAVSEVAALELRQVCKSYRV
jgi:hypothetical protein